LVLYYGGMETDSISFRDVREREKEREREIETGVRFPDQRRKGERGKREVGGLGSHKEERLKRGGRRGRGGGNSSPLLCIL
jgi:hypothetical protein